MTRSSDGDGGAFAAGVTTGSPGVMRWRGSGQGGGISVGQPLGHTGNVKKNIRI